MFCLFFNCSVHFVPLFSTSCTNFEKSLSQSFKALSVSPRSKSSAGPDPGLALPEEEALALPELEAEVELDEVTTSEAVAEEEAIITSTLVFLELEFWPSVSRKEVGK